METNNKLREALKAAKQYLDGYSTNILELRRKVDSALAEPVKNCEVGTPEEQAERFVEFCDEEKGNREHCRNCRLCNAQDCTLAWAQLPYEEGGAR